MLQTCNVVLLTFVAEYDVYQSCYGSYLFYKLEYECGYDKTNYQGCRLGICTSRTLNPYHLPRACGLTEITKNSAIADNPRDAFRGQSNNKVQQNGTKHGTIPYVRYGFPLVCYYSNFVPKSRRFSSIRLQRIS